MITVKELLTDFTSGTVRIFDFKNNVSAGELYAKSPLIDVLGEFEVKEWHSNAGFLAPTITVLIEFPETNEDLSNNNDTTNSEPNKDTNSGQENNNVDGGSN